MLQFLFFSLCCCTCLHEISMTISTQGNTTLALESEQLYSKLQLQIPEKDQVTTTNPITYPNEQGKKEIPSVSKESSNSKPFNSTTDEMYQTTMNILPERTETYTNNLVSSVKDLRLGLFNKSSMKNEDEDDDDEDEDEGDDDDDDDDGEDILDVINDAFGRLYKEKKDSEYNLTNMPHNYTACSNVYDKLNITNRTDISGIHKLALNLRHMWFHKKNISDDTFSMILSCLGYLLTEIENAHEFAKTLCISDVILPLMNCTSAERFMKDDTFPNQRCTAKTLRINGILVFSIAVLSSPRVQMAAFHHGATSVLLRIAREETDSHMRFLSLYALSNFLQNYAEAQAEFVRIGGMLILEQLFKKDVYEIQIEIFFMLHNLLSEHKKEIKGYPGYDLRIQYVYKAVGLEKALIRENWCANIAEFLVKEIEKRNSTSWKTNGKSNKEIDDWNAPKHDPRYLESAVNEDIEINFPLTDICHEEFNINIWEQDKWYKLLIT